LENLEVIKVIRRTGVVRVDRKPSGFKGFAFMSIGQFISMVGSAMTQFGLSIWIWKISGNATPFSIIATLFFIPNLIFSSFCRSTN